MDEENQINDKLKIMKFSLLPCGLKHTQFFIEINSRPSESRMGKLIVSQWVKRSENVSEICIPKK